MYNKVQTTEIFSTCRLLYRLKNFWKKIIDWSKRRWRFSCRNTSWVIAFVYFCTLSPLSYYTRNTCLYVYSSRTFFYEWLVFYHSGFLRLNVYMRNILHNYWLCWVNIMIYTLRNKRLYEYHFQRWINQLILSFKHTLISRDINITCAFPRRSYIIAYTHV